MATIKRPLGFANIDQAAEFFGLPKATVKNMAASGEWPSYVIGGQRVFDLDAILNHLVHSATGGNGDVQ